jgi:hypothetical protein
LFSKGGDTTVKQVKGWKMKTMYAYSIQAAEKIKVGM